jgi:FAD/FMN-containing dehydrogenase
MPDCNHVGTWFGRSGMKRRSFCAGALSVLGASSLSMRWSAAVPAVSTTGGQISLEKSDIDNLRAGISGGVLTPGQEGYESARKVWNGAFDRKPALIARCRSADDVAHAVRFARAHDVLVAVRSGGHSFPGHSACEGGLLIDLSPMKDVRVDASARRARVQSGVLLGEFDREAMAFGLATTTGTVSDTGAAGLTLGGGFGRLARRHGLACDNMIAADVVTADGRLVRASARENADLLWALRGGGGNFGVVTAFEYSLHAVPETMLGGALIFPFTEPRALLRSFADVTAGASDDLFVMLDVVPTPEGQRAVIIEVCHSGTPAAAEREVASLRKIGKVMQDAVAPTKYLTLQSRIDKDYPAGRCYYLKSGFVREITPKLIDTFVDYLESAPSRNGVASFIQLGGAVGRVKPEATAYWHREARYSVLMAAFWDDAAVADGARRWTREGWARLEPMTDGFYVNLMAADDSERRVRTAYGANLGRLAALKKQYDPTNLFRLNANIQPAA